LIYRYCRKRDDFRDNVEIQEIYAINDNSERQLAPIVIKSVKFGTLNREENEICSIDLNEMSKDDNVIFLPCRHAFHEECIYEWLEKSSPSKICPNCKASLERYTIELSPQL
jgi:hypothetical protein